MSALRISDYRDGSVRLVPLDVEPVYDWTLGDVERRFLGPDELALIRERDTPTHAPKPRRVTGVLSRAEIDRRREQMRAEKMARRAAQRDADAAERRARKLAEREARKGTLRHRPTTRIKVTDEAVVAMLRELKGNRAAAARRLGIANQTLRQRVDVMSRYGLLPEDVAHLCAVRYRGAA